MTTPDPLAIDSQSGQFGLKKITMDTRSARVAQLFDQAVLSSFLMVSSRVPRIEQDSITRCRDEILRLLEE